jgi:hypothetical protein
VFAEANAKTLELSCVEEIVSGPSPQLTMSNEPFAVVPSSAVALVVFAKQTLPPCFEASISAANPYA